MDDRGCGWGLGRVIRSWYLQPNSKNGSSSDDGLSEAILGTCRTASMDASFKGKGFLSAFQ